jgi:hypothetical protein
MKDITIFRSYKNKKELEEELIILKKRIKEIETELSKL